jgi:hypothetical protein
MAGEDGGFCVIVVGSAVQIGHRRTHAPCVRTLRRMPVRFWLLFCPETGLLDGGRLGPIPEFLELSNWSLLYQSYIAQQVYARPER